MKLKFLILVLALQSAWILGTTFVHERALITGEVIMLETRPVDPRDFLRGDYVILNYKISDVPSGRFAPVVTNGLPAGKIVYVALQKKGQFHEVVRASTEALTAREGEVILKGRTRYWWNTSEGTIHVEYGLERFYVREGTGSPSGKITVEAAVPSSGQARIKQAYIDGRPYSQAMKGS